MKTILLLLLFIFGNCMYFKVHVPGKFPYEKQKDITNLVIIENKTGKSKFITFDPFFLTWIFFSKEYENEYGSVSKLLLEELERNSDIYFPTDRVLEIQINKFSINSNDRCGYNVINGVMEVQVKNPKQPNLLLDYKIEKKINSAVTDCVTFLSFVSILGTAWYIPYVGFRGMKSDQVDYVGRFMLDDFFDKLVEAIESENKKPKK